MKKLIYVVLMTIILLTSSTGYAKEIKWSNICPDPGVIYCKNVGKDAYNANYEPKDIILGKITGVAWRPKGSIIGISEAIPKARILEEIRTSPRDAYYYIIDDGFGKPFVRQCRDISAK